MIVVLPPPERPTSPTRSASPMCRSSPSNSGAPCPEWVKRTRSSRTSADPVGRGSGASGSSTVGSVEQQLGELRGLGDRPLHLPPDRVELEQDARGLDQVGEGDDDSRDPRAALAGGHHEGEHEPGHVGDHRERARRPCRSAGCCSPTRPASAAGARRRAGRARRPRAAPRRSARTASMLDRMSATLPDIRVHAASRACTSNCRRRTSGSTAAVLSTIIPSRTTTSSGSNRHSTTDANTSGSEARHDAEGQRRRRSSRTARRTRAPAWSAHPRSSRGRTPRPWPATRPCRRCRAAPSRSTRRG